MIALFAGALAALSLGGGLAWLVGRDFAQRRAEEATRAALALSVSEERGLSPSKQRSLGCGAGMQAARRSSGRNACETF